MTQLLGIGIDPKHLSILQVCARGVVIFVCCIAIVRVGDKRFLSKKSAVDAVLGFIIASMMARAVNGSGALAPTIAAGFVIVLLHRLISHLARRSHRFGNLVKGRSELAIQNGEVREDVLRRNDFSQHDLYEDLRLSGVDSPERVKVGYIERNGRLSVVADRPEIGISEKTR